MRGGRHSRFTVFDIMEANGVFEANPANTSSSQYVGPVEYPKMFYHPTGQTRVVQRAEVLATPYGPVKVGEQFEMVTRVAKDQNEANRLVAAGWHDHPSKAIAAGGGSAPPITSPGRIADLEAQLIKLQAQLNAAKAAPPPEPDDDLAILSQGKTDI